MKLKVDNYTKTILTLLTIGVFANFAKDINWVGEAKAAEVAIPAPSEVKKTEGENVEIRYPLKFHSGENAVKVYVVNK